MGTIEGVRRRFAFPRRRAHPRLRHGGAIGAALAVLAGNASAQSEIAGWGRLVFDSRWTTESFLDVSAGSAFTVGVRSNGELAAWGGNWTGQCDVPTPPPGLTFVEAEAGFQHGVARLSNGTLVGWGSNGWGEATPPGPGGSPFVQISAGYMHSLALKANGAIVAWGGNGFGQTTLPWLPPGLTYVQVSAGRFFNLALRSDGSIVGWGHNDAGQANVPPLPPGLTYVEVSAGAGDASHSVARRSDGSVVAWGNNTYGQCNVPALPAGVTYTDIEAGWNRTLARRSDGVLVLWPNPELLPAIPANTNLLELELGASGVLRRGNGELISFGNNAWSQCNAPRLAPGLEYVGVSSGYEHFLALVSDGSVRCWGRNYDGECAVPSLGPGLTYIDLVGGRQGGAGIVSDGTVRVWGPYGAAWQVPQPPPGMRYVQVDLGDWHVVALRSDGVVVSWGDSTYGNTFGQSSVVPAPPGMTYTSVAAGRHHTLALRSDGQVIGWGSNARGQLNVPPAPPGVEYVRVTAFQDDSAALRSDGYFSLWGWAAQGTPPPQSFGTEFADLAIGGYEFCDAYGQCSDWWFATGARDDGSASTWGDNSWRQLDQPVLPAGTAFRDFDAGLHGAVGRYAPNHGLTAPFCTTSVSASGCTPMLSGVGQASASAATPFQVGIADVDGQRSALIFYGIDNSGYSPHPWAAGSTSTLCVAPPRQRTPVQTSGGSAGACDGTLSLDWNAFVASHPSALGQPFLAGSRVVMQSWFRDPTAPAGTNLSNGLDVAVWP